MEPGMLDNLCCQLKSDADAMMNASRGAQMAVDDETRNMYKDMQLTYLDHFQTVVMKITKELMEDENAGNTYQAQLGTGQPAQEV